MKTTPVLLGQHIGRLIKYQWYLRGKIKVIPTTAEEILKSQGIEVVDVKEFLKPPREKYDFSQVVGMYKLPPRKDEKHPDYKQEPCFIYKNEDVLIEGLEQAKALTNTVEICEGLPEPLLESEEKLNLPDEVHTEAKNTIKLSCMFNAMQEKLPKKPLDKTKIFWYSKIQYGITESKKNELLCKNLTTICEKFGKNAQNKSVIENAFFSTPIEAHNKKIQFELGSELVITTAKKLKAIAEPSITHDIALPDLYPMDCTAGLQPYNFYEMQNIYPVSINSKWPFIQIAFIHLNRSVVKNIIEEELTDSQINGRNLLKGFSIAAAKARAAFGDDIKKLPEPIVVPIVQTDGKLFHFSIFQLNTLELDTNSELKNIFWSSEQIPLYSLCEYVRGRPVLEGYNPDVLRKLMTFYDFES